MDRFCRNPHGSAAQGRTVEEIMKISGLSKEQARSWQRSQDAGIRSWGVAQNETGGKPQVLGNPCFHLPIGQPMLEFRCFEPQPVVSFNQISRGRTSGATHQMFWSRTWQLLSLHPERCMILAVSSRPVP